MSKPTKTKKPKTFSMAAHDWRPQFSALDKRGEVAVIPFERPGRPMAWLDARACREFAAWLLKAAEWCEARQTK